MRTPLSFPSSLKLAVKVLRGRGRLLKAISQGSLDDLVLSKVPQEPEDLDQQSWDEQEGRDMGDQYNKEKASAARVFSRLTQEQQNLVLAALEKAGAESKEDILQMLEDNLERPQESAAEPDEELEPVSEEESAQSRSQEGRFEAGIQAKQAELPQQKLPAPKK